MVAVIGDIHGCYFTLVELYRKIRDKYPDIKIYTVGDLVDRGNHSYEVVKFVMEEKINFIPGNHDYMFYHFFKEPQSVFARSWAFNGNETTLESYEDHESSVFDHIEFIKQAPLHFDTEDCFITHAGISYQYQSFLPTNFHENLALLEKFIYGDYKNDKGVLWTRDPLLNLGKLQVVGHTKQIDITLDEDSQAVYIDTGACVGNKLSAIIVNKSRIIETMEEKTNLNDII